mgnify:CR=1 FL=1
MAEPVKPIIPYKLLSAAELKNSPPPQWLLLDLLTVGSFAVLYGPPCVGKSFLALDFALSIATGQSGLMEPSNSGLVVYIVAEGHGGLRSRVEAWEVTYCEATNIRFLPEAVNFLLDLDSKRLLLALRALENSPRMVVVDTMARCMLGGDENSSEAVGRLIAKLDDIRKEFNSTILLVHHGTKNDDNVERGSSALRGAADTMLCLNGATHNLVLTCEKQKDAAEFKPMFLRLEVVQLTNGETSCVLLPTGKPAMDKGAQARTDIIDIVAGFPTPPTHAQIKERYMDTEGHTKSTFDRALKELLERGSVIKGADGKYRLVGG